MIIYFENTIIGFYFKPRFQTILELPNALDAFRLKLTDTYNWQVKIPKLSDVEKVIL